MKSAFCLSLLLCSIACLGDATFKVSDVEPNLSSLDEREESSLLSGGVEASSYGSERVIPCLGNPFLTAVMTAFMGHRPLSLSPDQVWLLIEQGFAAHLNANPKLLKRSGIVPFDGSKISLTVRRDDFVPGRASNPWPEVVDEFVRKIDQNCDKKMSELLVPRFSTTGPTETAVFKIVMMDAMKRAFDYRFETLCGIPSITLKGSPEDWEQLAARVQRLRGFEIDWWIDELYPILMEFARASKGHPRVDFWKSIFKELEESDGPYVNGWCVKFFPYILDPFDNPTKRNPMIGVSVSEMKPLRLARIPVGVSSVPFEWVMIAETRQMLFQAGFYGLAQDSESFAISPKICWVVRRRPLPPDGDKPLWQRILIKASRPLVEYMKGN